MNWLLFYVFNFVLYSFLGWILEEVYSYFTFGYFKEHGFLNVPFKPMYGIALFILIMFYYKFKVNNITLLILCIIVPTLIEYLSGYLLKNIYGEIYWSYKNLKYNFQGLICLKFSIYWSVLSFLVVKYLQLYINKIYYRFNSVCNMLAIILALLIVLDFVDISINHMKENRREIVNYTCTKIK